MPKWHPVFSILGKIGIGKNEAPPNVKYLSTKLLIFYDPENISVNNRLKFCATWECIVRLWQENRDFRNFCERSAIALTDKQDFSLVTQLMYCYPYFYDAGYLATGNFLYLRSNLLIQKPVLLLIIGILLVRYETQIGILV